VYCYIFTSATALINNANFDSVVVDAISLITFAFYGYLVVTIIFLLLDNKESTSTIAWLFILILFPVIGLIFYFMLGRNFRYRSKNKALHHQFLESRVIKQLAPIISDQEKEMDHLKQKARYSYKHKLLHLLFNNSDSVLTSRNNITLLSTGRQKFSSLIKDLENAKQFIHMEYFIWRNDKLTQQIQRILIRKAKEGVQIRILYDALGCVFLNKFYIRRMRKFGIQMFPYFNFLSPFSIHTLNYRNHRKIVIIDGQIAYTGGMNMGKEYVDGGKKFPSWVDLHMRVEGESVPILQGVFATSWYNTTKEDLFKPLYFPKPNQTSRRIPMQITTSGPDSEWESIKQLFFALITSAEKRVYVQSPYFIPDLSIYTALKTAALSGLDVRIMLTGKPDKRTPYWAAFTYLKELLQAGVKVYHYDKGFMHAKSIMIDGELCSIGTANMDVRSFHLNYEQNTLIYDRATTKEVEALFFTHLERCKQMTVQSYNKLTVFSRLRNSVARLFAPLL